jgi:phosphotriesterase-related protein
MKNLGWVRFNWLDSVDNWNLDDEDVMMEESLRFKYAGGRTIVDPGSIGTGVGRPHLATRRLALRTGLNIILGCGYYLEVSHPVDMNSKTIDDIKDEIVSDIRVGIEGSEIRSGVIGEIGISWPMGKNERKVLQGASRAQIETGAPMEIHPGRNPKSPAEIIEVLEQEKADLNKVILCHMERTIDDISVLEAIMDKGITIEFDLFGESWFQLDLEIPFPSDSMRIFQIKKLSLQCLRLLGHEVPESVDD